MSIHMKAVCVSFNCLCCICSSAMLFSSLSNLSSSVCGMQAISSVRKKLFNNRYTCPVEVNGQACKDLSPPVVRRGGACI